MGRMGRTFSFILFRSPHFTPNRFPLHHLTGDSFQLSTLSLAHLVDSRSVPRCGGRVHVFDAFLLLESVLLQGPLFLDAGAKLYTLSKRLPPPTS